MNSPTSAASNLPVVSATDLEKRIRQHKNEFLITLQQHPETAVLAGNFQRQQPQMQTSDVAIVAPEPDEAEELLNVFNSSHVLGAARLTHATSTETQEDKLAHAMIYAVSDVNENAAQVAVAVEKAWNAWREPLHLVVIVLQNGEKGKDGERLLREHVFFSDTTILPLSVPLWEASQTFTSEDWADLCKIGSGMNAESLNEALLFLTEITPERFAKELTRLTNKSSPDVVKSCAQLVRKESIKKGTALKKRVLRESGMEELAHRFHYLRYPDMPALVELLRVAKQLAALYEKAVFILADVVQAETKEQKRADELHGVLEKLTEGETAGFSQRKSLGALQAAIAYINKEPLQQDSQELTGTEQALLGDITPRLGDIKKKLIEVRGAISRAFDPLDRAVEILQTVGDLVEERVKTRQEQAEESRYAATSIIEGLKTVEDYLKSGGHPPSGSDVEDAALALLGNLRTNNEKRLKMAKEVLNAVRDSHGQLQSDVAMFEEDIRCLIHLASPDTEVEEPDKTTLARLFGRYGTDVTTRVEVEVPPEDPAFNKQALQAIDKLFDELDTRRAVPYLLSEGDSQMIEHARAQLDCIYNFFDVRSGESQHDN